MDKEVALQSACRSNTNIMIEDNPPWLDLLFLLTFGLTIWMFHLSNGKSNKLTGLVLVWSTIQGVLAYCGFYQITNTMPPRFGLMLVPAFVFVALGLRSKHHNWMIESRHEVFATLLHTVRIPVEIVLYFLFVQEMIPELMTFAGRNFDIVMGISAPFIAWQILKGKCSKAVRIAWNAIGVILVLFVLINGTLSAEMPFQQLGFEQPNRAIAYFPYILLPATIVPIVVWTHLSAIILLLKTR